MAIFLVLVLLLSGCHPVFAAPCQDKVCIKVYTDPKTGRVVIQANRGKPGATTSPKPIATKPATPKPKPTRTWKPRPYTPRPYTPRPYTPRPRVSRKPISLSDQLSRLIPGSVINKLPSGDALVQMPIKFSTNTDLLFQTLVTILGTAVQVSLTPQFRWDFGDGGSSNLNTKNIEHTYRHDGDYLVTLQVSWSGNWLANGVISPITGGAIVKEARTLVSVKSAPTKYAQ